MTDTITLEHRDTLTVLDVLRSHRRDLMRDCEHYEERAYIAETRPGPADPTDPNLDFLDGPTTAEYALNMRALAAERRAWADDLSRIIDHIADAL